MDKVIKLSNKVTRILGCNPGIMTLQGTNTYVVGSGPKRILIDTGERNKPEYINLLTSFLNKESIDLEHVIITHWHHDHIGGVSDVYKNIKNEPVLWKYSRTDSANPSTVDSVALKYLNDGQQIFAEGATLKVISTPGHTTDHIVLYLLEENALFSGDCILGGSTTVFEDLYEYTNSLNIILKLNPQTIYPGHGHIINNPKPEIEEVLNHRKLRENQILETLKETGNLMTSLDIVKIIYADKPETLFKAAEQNVLQHLRKLEKENCVECFNNNWKLKTDTKENVKK